MKKNYNISFATPKDFTQITEIWFKSVLATHHFVAKNDLMSLKTSILNSYLPAMAYILLYQIENRTKGFLAGNGKNVEMLFVHPKFFSLGIGTLLLNSAANLYGSLKLSVNVQNEYAINFYLRRGFSISGYSTHDNQNRQYPLFHLEQE